jgi:hypothetical protein
MKRLACLAALAVVLAGCDEDISGYPDAVSDTAFDPGTDTSYDPGTDTGLDPAADTLVDPAADTAVDAAGDDAPAGCVPTIGSGSNFTTVAGFMDYVNEQRRNYGGEGGYGRHDRYKGIPWTGTYHTVTTFPNAFPWDDGLAARAQEEACRLAAGGAVSGTRVDGASPGQKPFWIYGINTADWMISCKEDPGDWEPVPFGGDMAFGLHHSNGSSRLGLHYHDFGGDGPVINLVGAGAADAGGGSTWWVLQFGP